MSIEIDTDMGLDFADWLECEETGRFQRHLEKKIMEFLFCHDPNEASFQKIIAQLAWMGTVSEKRSLLGRDIAELKLFEEEIELCGLSKSIRKIGRFIKKHKKEILIGVVICAVAIGVACATGNPLNVCVGGVAIAGKDSIFSKPEKPNPALPKDATLPPPGYTVPFLPKLELPPSEALVFTPEGVWINGQFSSNEALLQNSIFAKDWEHPFFPQIDSLSFEKNETICQELPKESSSIEPKQPSWVQQFVEMVEAKLTEAKSPDYANQFLTKSAHTADYQEALRKIEKRLNAPLVFPKGPKAPLVEVPLIGRSNQNTIHFHCGINNDISSIVDGGFCLSNGLDQKFAIQPHLIHSNDLISGLAFVGLEKAEEFAQEHPLSGYVAPITQAPGVVLQNSQIQKSIDYEVENLSRLAKEIIEQKNPRLKQAHVTFSNGGYVFKEALKQLPDEYRETIIVITAGTTAIIDDHLAHKVYNVIGEKDWPSQICNGGMSGILEARKRGMNVELIPQIETQGILGGHYFVQPDYQYKISIILKDEISNRYEIH